MEHYWLHRIRHSCKRPLSCDSGCISGFFMDESNSTPDKWAGKKFVCDGIYECRALPYNRYIISVDHCAGRTLACLSPFSTVSQMVTAKAPPLPPVFLCISPPDRGGNGVNPCQRFLPVHNFDCVWRLNSTVGKCFTICALDICGRASAGEERAQCSV